MSKKTQSPKEHSDHLYSQQDPEWKYCPGCGGPAGLGPEGTCRLCWKDRNKASKRRYLQNQEDEE